MQPVLTDAELDELTNSDEYAEYIMQHGDRPICNGDSLIVAMESLYLFDAFLEDVYGIEEQ